MEFDNNKPIYLQLLEDFRIKISVGAWKPGGKILPVRDLAKTYEVNPNTVQRALQELEREGLCESRRTAGRFVTEDKILVTKLSNKSFELLADDFIGGCENLNLTKEESLDLLSKYWEENYDKN